MACLKVGRAVQHGRRHDLTPNSCKGLTFYLFRAHASLERTRNCEVFMHQSAVGPGHALKRCHIGSDVHGPFWTSLTASATNSITYNYVTAHEPGGQPVRDGSPGLN